MNGPTHDIGAAAAAAAVAYAGELGLVGGGCVIAVAYMTSCLPDRDRHYEQAWGRRSATHSVALGLFGAWALVSVVPYEASLGPALGPLAYAAAWGLVVGWLSHLVLDALTVEGVPLLLPGVGPTLRLPLTQVKRPATATEWLVRAGLAACLIYAVAGWALALAQGGLYAVGLPADVGAPLVAGGGG